MYVCPTCQKIFESEADITKHSLKCWKEKNPFHQSKSAPHGVDKTERKVSSEVFDFFASFERKN